MSSFVEKIIEEKGEQIKKETIQSINSHAKSATTRFNRIIEELKEQAKIVLPVNIIDILAKGGKAHVVEVNVPDNETDYSVSIGHVGLLEPHRQEGLKAGKYRLILIFERIGPANEGRPIHVTV